MHNEENQSISNEYIAVKKFSYIINLRHRMHTGLTKISSTTQQKPFKVHTSN